MCGTGFNQDVVQRMRARARLTCMEERSSGAPLHETPRMRVSMEVALKLLVEWRRMRLSTCCRVNEGGYRVGVSGA